MCSFVSEMIKHLQHIGVDWCGAKCFFFDLFYLGYLLHLVMYGK